MEEEQVKSEEPAPPEESAVPEKKDEIPETPAEPEKQDAPVKQEPPPQTEKPEQTKKPNKIKKILKFFVVLAVILVVIAVIWTVFSLIGRVDPGAAIPSSSVVRVTVSNPVRLIDGVLAHEPLYYADSVPSLAAVVPVLDQLRENPVLGSGFVRFLIRGKMELALLSPDEGNGTIAAAWDMGLLSPLLRILPTVSNFIDIPGLYYVQTGSNSRFEYRLENMTLYIGPYRNLLYITDSDKVYEARSRTVKGGEDEAKQYENIKPSSYDVALLISHEFINGLFAGQDPAIAAVIDSLEFSSSVEAGLSLHQKKFEFRLTTPLVSEKPILNRFITQRSQVPQMAERFPASTQYATVLSAGTLEELFQATLVFTPDMGNMLDTANSAARFLLNGLTLNDLLFSWSGKEYAVFGIEGRPHPVYAIEIADERKRQQVFDQAFKSIVLNEDARLNLDGVRIPRIEIPEFLQALLRRWNVILPKPYYIIYKDFFITSESADTLLAAVRAMQRNDVLPKSNEWREIAGGRSVASSFSLYYSLDRTVPFFLRNNTALSGFLSLYRQGLIRMGFNKNIMDLSIALIPGSGNGVSLMAGYPLIIDGLPSNRVYGAGKGADGRIFLTSGSSSLSIDLADNSIYQIGGQGASHWVIPADGVRITGAGKNAIYAWVVSNRGRVTLVDGNMEPAHDGFPLTLGLRLSSPPQAFDGKLYICDDDGKVHVIDEKGEIKTWETSFTAPLPSPPSFLSVAARGGAKSYAGAYPKSFFGEIWLLDADGKAMPSWPASISVEESDITFYEDITPTFRSLSGSSGIGYGTPLVFSHNNKVLVAFVCQDGELIVYDENAAYVSPFPLYLDGVFYLQPVYDGEYLWLVSANGTLFRVGINGELLYQTIPGFSVKEEGYLTVFDCDGDKTPEVFITGEGNALQGYTRSFRSLEGFPLPVWGRPHFIEAQNTQGGKKAEVVGIGMDRRLYRWQFR